MWSSALPVSLFSRISLFIAILSHLLGLLGTACRRSARFARFARSRASLARHLGPSWARLGLPKPSQDSSKIPKIAFWKRLGRVFGPSRRRLGASWHYLGPSWRLLGPSWRYLGPSWRHLGPSWRHLGTSWARLGLPKTSQDSSKTPPRRLPRRSPT